MRRLIVALAGGLFGSLLVAAAVAAADPTATPSTSTGGRGTTGTAAQVLGLTQAQLQDLRHDGLSLAQIAERQKVAVQKVVDALIARWTERIDARVAAGALTAAEGQALKAKLSTTATQMVNNTEPGGMGGAAVGAGRGNAGGGNGSCDGTGTGDGFRGGRP
jgi:hypothetical protein